MKIYILSLLITLNIFLSFSQNKDTTYPNFIGNNLTSIENNQDWKILVKAAGDLNNDQVDDLTLILESKDSIPEKRCDACYLLKNKPRIIIVLLSQNGDNKVVIQNNKFIARGDEGGMVSYIEPDISIENQQLTISYEYTRSNQSYTFEFINGKMEIISAESNGVSSASGDYEIDTYDFKKGEIIAKTGNISESDEITEIIKIDIKPKLLSNFGKMYDWEIIEYKYL